MNTITSEAYKEGWRAYLDDDAPQNNPYRPDEDTYRWNEWEDGWLDAHKTEQGDAT